MLRRFYANKLRRFYANKLRNHYAIITQINYADFTQINYAIITQSLRMLRSHYANKLRRFYANKLRNSLRRLRNSITQIRLRNSPKCHYADYANTDFHYAKIQFITQWATCWWKPGYPGIYTKSGYYDLGISRDILCGRFSRCELEVIAITVAI